MAEDRGRAAILTETSLLMAVFFLGTNPVAVKLAVLDVPPLPFVASIPRVDGMHERVGFAGLGIMGSR